MDKSVIVVPILVVVSLVVMSMAVELSPNFGDGRDQAAAV